MMNTRSIMMIVATATVGMGIAYASGAPTQIPEEHIIKEEAVEEIKKEVVENEEKELNPQEKQYTAKEDTSNEDFEVIEREFEQTEQIIMREPSEEEEKVNQIYNDEELFSPIQITDIIRLDPTCRGIFITEIELTDNNIYKIEGFDETYEYEFKLDAVTGEMLEAKRDEEYTDMSRYNGIMTAEGALVTIISEKKYKDVLITEIEFDDDFEYELKGYKKNHEYEFELNATNGKIEDVDKSKIKKSKK